VAAVAQRHEQTLLRVARQASLCHDDALDAYQRALEIFVRRVDTVDPATEVAWLKVVIRHEAMAIRRARSESVTGEELDFDAFVPAKNRSVDDEIAATERVRRSAEALRALKPDEAKALMMKANGLSYDEIGELNGWSYTKVNRAVTEGRRRFLAAFEGIESGNECERFAPVVEALAAGSASATQIVSIRPHLRHCSTCRAAIRDLHLSRIRRASLFWPGFLLAAASTRSEEEWLAHTLAESGAPVDNPASRLTDLKHRIVEIVHRAPASDVATGVQITAAGGGGRVASVATAIALCLSSAGAATVCVVGNLVDRSPQRLEQRHSSRTGPSRKERRNASANVTSTAPAPSPAPTTTGASRVSHASDAAITKRRQGANPAPKRKGKARDLAQEEFGFEQGTPSSASTTPPPAPASQPIATSATTHSSNDNATSSDPAQEEFGP
jgi:RNA polymerase sigma factor (sigma-70 family)